MSSNTSATNMSIDIRRIGSRQKWTIVGLALVVFVVYRAASASRQAGLSAALIDAIENDRTREVTKLLTSGANPNSTRVESAQEDSEWTKWLGWLIPAHRHHDKSESALAIAVGAGNADVVKALLAFGADAVNSKSADGTSLLMCALGWDNAPMALALLEAGAGGVNDRDEPSRGGSCRWPGMSWDYSGFRPLSWVCSEGHPELVKPLLKHGADPNGTDNNGRTALMWAAYDGCESAVPLLLQYGANPNLRDKDGHTALWVAQFMRSWEMARQLKRAVPARF